MNTHTHTHTHTIINFKHKQERYCQLYIYYAIYNDNDLVLAVVCLKKLLF